MNRVTIYQVPADAPALAAAASAAVVPPSLVDPLQGLVTGVTRRAAESPQRVYVCAGDDAAPERDHFAALLARTLAAHLPSTLVVDCDFLRVGLGGLVPQKDALGFLDYLLYGSSIGVITQEAAGGLHVVGSGSFPVTRRMPFVASAFGEASQRLAAHARCVLFVGPALDEDGSPHPLTRETDAVVVVRPERAPALDAVEEAVSSGAEVWSLRLGAPPVPVPVAMAPAPAAHAEVPVLTPPPRSRERARSVRSERRYTSLAPRIAILVFAMFVIAFVVWWFGQNRGGDAPDSGAASIETRTPAEPAPSAADTSRSDAVAGQADSLPPVMTPPVFLDTARVVHRAPASPSLTANPADTGGRSGGTVLINPADIHVMVDLERNWRDWFVIHISSFQESIRARQEVAFLESREFPVFIVFLDLGAKGKWYRVYAGPFQTREEARDVKKNLDAIPQVRFTRITKIPE